MFWPSSAIHDSFFLEVISILYYLREKERAVSVRRVGVDAMGKDCPLAVNKPTAGGLYVVNP